MFSNGEFDLGSGVSSSGTWTQSAANIEHYARGNTHFVIMQSNGSQEHISGCVFVSYLCNYNPEKKICHKNLVI